jgi:hypothetical protein
MKVGGRQNFWKIFLNTKYTKVTKGKRAQNRQGYFLGVLCDLRVCAFQKSDAHPMKDDMAFLKGEQRLQA